MNVLKDAFNTVGETLLDIINQSFNIAVFPSAFKTSTVILIQKVPKPIKSKAFRPINMLPVYGKTMECIVGWSDDFENGQYGLGWGHKSLF
jgi:hypothetical protein